MGQSLRGRCCSGQAFGADWYGALALLKTLFPWRRPSRCSYNKPGHVVRASLIEPAPAKVAELADAPDLGLWSAAQAIFGPSL
jgi:hypothetical protein